jgi:hypothetical protein
MISDLRAEAGKARISAKEQAATQAAADARAALLKELSGSAEAPLSVEQLQAKLKASEETNAARDTELWNLRVEAALPAAAAAAGADPILLRNQFAFDGTVDDLDPTAADFTTKLETLAKEAIAKHPQLKAQARAAGASGVEITGGSGEPAQITDPAVIAKMSPEQIVDALEKGKLRAYMAS